MKHSPSINIKSFEFSDKDSYQISIDIRTKVFIEEQGVDPAIEREFEETATYYLLFIGQKPVATARWRPTKEGIKLERFAMLSDYRNQGYGSLLLDRVLADVIPYNLTIYLHAQENAVNYYMRRGFTIQGESFSEANIIHYNMVL